MAQLKQLMILYFCLSCLPWEPDLYSWHICLAKAQSFAACQKDSCPHPEYYMMTSAIWLCLLLLLLFYLCSVLTCNLHQSTTVVVLLSWAPNVFIEEYTKERKLSEVLPVLWLRIKLQEKKKIEPSTFSLSPHGSVFPPVIHCSFESLKPKISGTGVCESLGRS